MSNILEMAESLLKSDGYEPPVDLLPTDKGLVDELDELILAEKNSADGKGESEEAITITPPEGSLPAETYALIAVIKQKIEMYKVAESNAKAAGESAKVRRCERSLKSLKDILKQALAGKSVNVDDIPPEISMKSEAPQPAADGNDTKT